MKDKKTIVIAVVVILGLLILGVILYAVFAKNTTVTQTGPKGSATGGIGSILGNILGVFTGGQCDPSNPGFTKNGTRDTKCDTNATSSYVNTCDPNTCDPNNPGYDMCGNFKMGC